MPKHFKRPDRLTTGELAEFLEMPRRTILNRLRAGIIPEPGRVGNWRYWTLEEAGELKERPEGRP